MHIRLKRSLFAALAVLFVKFSLTASVYAAAGAVGDVSESPHPLYNLFWILPALGLYYIFNQTKAEREEKALALNRTAEEGGRAEDKIRAAALSKKQAIVSLLLTIIILVAALIFLINGSYFAALFATGTVITLYMVYPRALRDVWRIAFSDPEGRNETETSAVKEEEIDVTFEDIGGLENIVEELREIAELIKNPEEARRWNIRIPRGILLIGPTGCGKTRLAKAFARETGLPFFAYSPKDTGDIYVRSGAKAVQEIYRKALSKAPCVIFLDEIDAIGRRRGHDTHAEYDHALNQLLVEMRGFYERRDKIVITIGATNREDTLDEALVGRFDMKFLVPKPDISAREKILSIHLRESPLSPKVNLAEIAKDSSGFSGEDLSQVAEKAAKISRRKFKKDPSREGLICQADLEEAVLEVMLGGERRVVSKEEEQIAIARHELGHAIVAMAKGSELVKKITLMPRNWALGATITRTEEGAALSKKKVLAIITKLLGGRAAELVFYGKDDVMTGAAHDILKASELAQRMIWEWGMGSTAPLFCRLEDLRMGRRPYSEETVRAADLEVLGVLQECMKEAENIVAEEKGLIEYLTPILMERTSIDSEELEKLIHDFKEKRARG